MAFTVEIPELPGLLKKLATVAKPAQIKAVFRKSLRKHAKPMAATAKQLAPVHAGPYPPHRTDRKPGTLRRTIKVKAIKRTRTGVGVRISDHYTGGGYYGAFQEYGTKRQKAQPYLRPAFDRHKQGVIDGVKADVQAAVEGAFKS